MKPIENASEKEIFPDDKTLREQYKKYLEETGQKHSLKAYADFWDTNLKK